MKIQYLAVIFVLIVVPIAMIMSVYIQNQIDAITLQQTYDSSLINATYDAVKAFQLNTLNNKYSGVNDSKMRDISASVNTFYNSLLTSMSDYVQTTDDLKGYTPALLYTLYDGFYIYSTYANVYDTTQNTTSSGDEILVDLDLDSREYENGLKPYVYYSAKYRLDNGDTIVINYTLDNYITIYGNVLENGDYVARSGYLIDPSLVTSINTNSKTLTYDGIRIRPEDLQEHLIILSDDDTGTTATEGDYYYIVYQNNKIYQEGSGSNAQYFYYTNECKKSYVNEASDLYEYLEENRTTYGNGDHICSTSAFDYYYGAYTFSTWVINETKLDEITQEDMVLLEDSTKTIADLSDSERSSYLAENVTGSFLIPSEENNPILSESMFNNHRIAIIRKTIETALSAAIANYSSQYLYEYEMPVLTDEDWYKIVNNVSVTSFLQGLSIGYRYYNNYAIVTNNTNEEAVNPENIYLVVKTADGNREYHQAGCEELIQGINDGTLTLVGGYPSYGFQRQTVEVNENLSYYYYPQNVESEYLTSCYNCIVNATYEFDLEDIIAGNNLTGYENGTEYVVYEPEDYTAVRQAFLTALGRERQDLYKSNVNMQTTD